MNIRRIAQWINEHPYLFLLLVLTPVMLLREFTPRNELRYLSIADDALANGRWWSFSFDGEPYADKPPLYLWMVMLVRGLLGESLMPLQRWLICLFSLLPYFGVLRLMRHWTDTHAPTGSINRGWSFWMLATCGMFLGISVFARMDMLMTLFILLTLYLYWTQGNRWLIALYLFLALFTKGPLGLLIPWVAILSWSLLSHEWHRCRNVFGWQTWLVLMVGCSVWWYCVWREAGCEYLENLLFHQTRDRAVAAFHHQQPWWYYLAHVWYCTLPWGPFCLCCMGWALLKARKTMLDLQRFFVVSFLSSLVLLSCLSGKLDIYLVPVYPMLVYGGMMAYRQWQTAHGRYGVPPHTDS